MQKIIGIILLEVILVSCSVPRKAFTEERNESFNGSFMESIERQNVTATGFFIQKAEIEIKSTEIRERFIANLKFSKPDKYLISLRSRTGIEGARVYISGDSILVNDRINKKLYSGNSLYLSRKFGLSQSILPLLFGDLINDKKNEGSQIVCKGNIQNLESRIKGMDLNYIIDCNKRKVLSVKQGRSIEGHEVDFVYSKFFRIGNIFVPKIIELTDIQNNTKIKIKILKLEKPWEGNILFVPGKGYELIELL